MFVITPGTEAFDMLKAMVNHPSTYKIRVAYSPDAQSILLKQNEGTWSPPLSVEVQRHDVIDKITPPPMPQVGDRVILRFPNTPPVEGVGEPVTEQLAPETCIYRGQPGFSRCSGPVTRDPGGDPACATHQRIVHPSTPKQVYILQTWVNGAWADSKSVPITRQEAKAWQNRDPDNRRVLDDDTREVVYQPVD